jgi:hypothetical protein
MIKDKDVQYMRIALGMCGIGVSNCTTEIILKTFQATKKMKGDFDLMTAAKIQVETEEKYSSKFVPAVTIDGLEKFYEETVKELNASDPNLVNSGPALTILNSLRNLIENHRDIPI